MKTVHDQAHTQGSEKGGAKSLMGGSGGPHPEKSFKIGAQRPILMHFGV